MSDAESPNRRRWRDRPDVVATQAQRINTAHGKVYVRIGMDDAGRPLEVFIDSGVSGGYANSWAEALAKTISNALQCGTPPMEIADDLLGISSGKVQTDNGDNIYSEADAVGIALVRFQHDRLASGESKPVRGDALESHARDDHELPAEGTGPIDVAPEKSHMANEGDDGQDFLFDIEGEGDIP